jgi:hypothetical protein
VMSNSLSVSKKQEEEAAVKGKEVAIIDSVVNQTKSFLMMDGA